MQNEINWDRERRLERLREGVGVRGEVRGESVCACLCVRGEMVLFSTGRRNPNKETGMKRKETEERNWSYSALERKDKKNICVNE